MNDASVGGARNVDPEMILLAGTFKQLQGLLVSLVVKLEVVALLIEDAESASENNVARNELGALLEASILALPAPYRVVLVLRDIEEMSTSETAQVLALTDANVKVRLHRAHELLRSELTLSGPLGADRFVSRRSEIF